MDSNLKNHVKTNGLKAWLAMEEPSMVGRSSKMPEIVVSEMSFTSPWRVATFTENLTLGERAGAGRVDERLIEENDSSYLPFEGGPQDPVTGPNVGYSPACL